MTCVGRNAVPWYEQSSLAGVWRGSSFGSVGCGRKVFDTTLECVGGGPVKYVSAT